MEGQHCHLWGTCAYLYRVQTPLAGRLPDGLWRSGGREGGGVSAQWQSASLATGIPSHLLPLPPAAEGLILSLLSPWHGLLSLSEAIVII